MLRGFTYLLAIALILLMQGPALLLQEVAWAGMLLRYSQASGIQQGVINTFDGKHPCKLCLKAAKMREQERDDPMNAPEKELRARMKWAEMQVVVAPRLKSPTVTEVVTPRTPHFSALHGRSPDAPSPPPPKTWPEEKII